MKHSLKISSLIIFAATVASTFTSCGNDSELFDEPVVHQTRAMTRASMRTEPWFPVITQGDETITKKVYKDKVSLSVTLAWGPDSALTSGTTVSIKSVKPIYHDKRYKKLDYYPANFAEIHNGDATVDYYVSEVYKEISNGVFEKVSINERFTFSTPIQEGIQTVGIDTLSFLTH